MNVSCFQLTDDLRLLPQDYARLVQAPRSPGARFWIDVQGAEPAALEGVLDTLQVTGLARRLCRESGERAGFYPIKGMTLLVVPLPADVADDPSLRYITLLARADLLLTIHNLPLAGLESGSTLEESPGWLPESSVAGLLAAQLIALSLSGLRQAGHLKDLSSAGAASRRRPRIGRDGGDL